MTPDQTNDDRPLPYDDAKKPPENAPNSPILKRPVIIGDLTLASPTTQTTIGANGAASALTANPVGYVTVMIGNSPFIVPYYNI